MLKSVRVQTPSKDELQSLRDQQGIGEVRGRPYHQFVNPPLSELLESLRLDKCFVRGKAHLLFDEDGTSYLDAISGYGSVPFGHNPEWVWQAVHDFEHSGEPSIAQPSILPGAGALAAALLQHGPPGLKYVTFANSGAEAVEAAIKACRLATGRLGIMSTDNGFHGKTLGALSATGRDAFQEGCGAPVAGFSRIPFGDLDALERAFQEHASQTAAFIVEPIQGEGGVVEAPAGYLAQVRRLCDQFDVLLVVDEIQTGLGRTGSLFACSSDGVTPDVLTVAKALGGGLVPVAACLLSERAYSKKFALKHSSTFAGNGLAMRIGLRVVEHLTSPHEGVLDNVVRQGHYLRRGLCNIQRKYRSAIREVRGRGLMLGVELGTDPASIERGVGSFISLLGDDLPAFAASYLLNVCHVRVAPTLNGGAVLRVQPPLTVTREECDWIINAFDRLASVMTAGKSNELIRHLLREAEPEPKVSQSGFFRAHEVTGPQGDEEVEEGRFAFVLHMLDGKSLSEFDRSLCGIAPADLEELADRFESPVEPFVASTVRIESPTGRAAKGDFIVVPKTTRQLLRMSPDDATEAVAAAVRLARQRGAKIVGLGGYTSIVPKNLKVLMKLDVALTSGNSYTVVSAVEAAFMASRVTGQKLETRRAAIVGGGGSIGSALASALAENVPSLALVTREVDSPAMRSRYALILARMARHLVRRSRLGVNFHPDSLGHAICQLPFAHEMAQNDYGILVEDEERMILDQARRLPIQWTRDLPGTVTESDLIFLATSSPDELIKSSMVRPGTVICDLSRPANVGPDLFTRDDILVIDGGIIELPGRPNLGFHFGLARGQVFACMAETIMLGLEHRYEHTSMGRDLRQDTLDLLANLATKHGFKLAGSRSRQRATPLQTISHVERAPLVGRMAV